MKLIYSFLIVIFVSSCASITITDISKAPQFSQYTERELTLKNQVLICQDKPLKRKTDKPIEYQLIYNVNLITKCHFGLTKAILPKGTVIKIKSIEEHANFPPIWSHVYFIGTHNLTKNSQLEFYYFYSYDKQESFGKMPWL